MSVLPHPLCHSLSVKEGCFTNTPGRGNFLQGLSEGMAKVKRFSRALILTKIGFSQLLYAEVYISRLLFNQLLTPSFSSPKKASNQKTTKNTN